MTAAGPSNVRRRFVAVSMAMAFILYLDRVCLAQIVGSASFNSDISLSPHQVGRLLGIFFIVYGLFQVPAGWISDRFGGRQMLTAYIVLWSLATACTGLVSSFPALLGMRLLCGAAEAGAYPTSGALLRRWIPLAARARASSLVAVGGRIGGTAAPFITASLVVRLGQWRPALWLDGAAGLAIAAAYWAVVRNRPSEHPACNQAEQALIGSPPAEGRPSVRELGGMLGSFCLSRSLWCCAAVMFLINFGWAFLITWLPTYLKVQKHAGDLSSGRMVTLVLACGMLGQLAGGWIADRAARRFGLKRGRAYAVAVAGLLAGTGYVGCLFVSAPWAIVGCCGVVSFGVDMGNPAHWSFVQDVGGRVTAAAFGWINMWGNFGAAAVAQLVPTLVAAGLTQEAGQSHVFMACAVALFLSSVAALGMDASRPLAAGAAGPSGDQGFGPVLSRAEPSTLTMARISRPALIPR